ncbi:hypothetical protein N7478_006084 [Penicillium angulare]|uniref:uncharacterized protein n=1 Tax=Penicillium angulare TaxID=116970 RepID=UPI00254262A2|nr:uncharacterized protein N7478_006084 [Penicillium angulare]KAJ5280712.1 hypothetical protein N7478_006084 [Penicillium angulare]
MSTPNQVKQPFAADSANSQDQDSQSYKEWLQEAYNNGYQRWMPWIEDQYLKWFGKGDNKASYATKDSLSKTKVTGIDQVDQIQDDTNNLVGNQLGDKGLFKPVGQFMSKEGINRAERDGKDEDGSYGDSSTFTGIGAKGVDTVGSGAESTKNIAVGGLNGVKGLVSGSGQ